VVERWLLRILGVSRESIHGHIPATVIIIIMNIHSSVQIFQNGTEKERHESGGETDGDPEHFP